MRALLATVVSGVVLAATASASIHVEAVGAGCRWHVVLDRPGPELSGVAALTDRDVWAVGNDGPRGSILHWNGRVWQSGPSPFLAFDVDADSARDVWAVGSSAPGGLQTRPRAARWDGRRWTEVTVPGGPGSYLRAVAVLSRGDAWAVGARERGPLAEHWNGSAWTAIPGGPRDGVLLAIDAPSPDDAWAVGTQGMTTLGPQSEDSLVERLQADRWHSLPTPELAWLDDHLLAVSAASPTDVWAVGSVDDPDRVPLVERWNGQSWSLVSTNGLSETWTALSAVAAFGPEDVWAAGSEGIGSGERALLAHWDGVSWAPVRGPAGGLADIAALSRDDLWAVGGALDGQARSRTLVEHFSCSSD